MDSELEAESAEQDEAEPEPLEPQEAEELADSDACVEGEAPPELSDEEERLHPPTINRLPRRLRPPVLFRIDEKFAVHRLSRADDEHRYAIACAIAVHLERSAAELSRPGDWCHVPAVGLQEELLPLVAPDILPLHERERLGKALKSNPAQTKSFACMLPNGDIVSPDALIAPARKGKRATRAGALRLAAERPGKIAGEEWSAVDWDGFEKTQKKSVTRSKPNAERTAPAGEERE